MMTALHLIQKSPSPCSITIIDRNSSIGKGVAYSPYSQKHLLNVITAKMSAFPDRPNHFLDWVMKQEEYGNHDRELVANSFLPRHLYGKYLSGLWEETIKAAETKGIKIAHIPALVTDIDLDKDLVKLTLSNGTTLDFNYGVIASGNNLPGNPSIKNRSFFNSENYFQDPWQEQCVANTGTQPILIIGNGLTMVDTVLALQENGFKGKIYSLSPKGFNILPHRHNGLKYNKISLDLENELSLQQIVTLVNKHIKSVREFGVTAEPVIDSIRPYTHQIWKRLSDEEKKLFMSRLRHLWGVARHRIPLHIHDKIQALRIAGILDVIAGRLIDINEAEEGIAVEYFDKKKNRIEQIEVSRVINCTGPETNFEKLPGSFLNKCLQKGILTQDILRLGITADTETFNVTAPDGKKHDNLFTLGSHLKGELWESTAVSELRQQAEKLAAKLVSRLPA